MQFSTLRNRAVSRSIAVAIKNERKGENPYDELIFVDNVTGVTVTFRKPRSVRFYVSTLFLGGDFKSRGSAS